MNQDEKRWIVLLVAVIIIAVVFFVVLGIKKNNQENVAGFHKMTNKMKNNIQLSWMTEQN